MLVLAGAEKYTLSGHSGYVRACAFSPDGSTVLSGSNDTTLKLWDSGTGVPSPSQFCIDHIFSVRLALL